jgi:hypothetical protein
VKSYRGVALALVRWSLPIQDIGICDSQSSDVEFRAVTRN